MQGSEHSDRRFLGCLSETRVLRREVSLVEMALSEPNRCLQRLSVMYRRDPSPSIHHAARRWHKSVPFCQELSTAPTDPWEGKANSPVLAAAVTRRLALPPTCIALGMSKLQTASSGSRDNPNRPYLGADRPSGNVRNNDVAVEASLFTTMQWTILSDFALPSCRVGDVLDTAAGRNVPASRACLPAG